MSEDLVDRLHWHHNFIGTNPGSNGYPFLREVRDRLGEAADRIEQLERELSISRMAQVVMDNGAEALEAENARLREALNQSRLAFAGYVSVQSAIDLIDRAALKGETHD